MALKVIQVNLQHKKAASAAFCKFVVKENVDIALIQEPWVHQGLGDCKGKLIHCGIGDLLQLDRSKLRRAIALITGHGQFRKHLRTVGLYNGEITCRLCNMMKLLHTSCLNVQF